MHLCLQPVRHSTVLSALSAVIPAKAGPKRTGYSRVVIALSCSGFPHHRYRSGLKPVWAPAFAGVTKARVVDQINGLSV
jgi:hypothetical protein